jgi:chromosome segregation ATPase
MRSRRVTGSLLSESTLAERDMALVLREAELNRREAALRRAAEAGAEDEGHTQEFPELEQALEARLLEVEQRERELQAMIEAVAAQRELIESVRSEYQLRLDGLAERTREVEAERNRLRDEQAQLVCASLELEDAGRPAEPGTRPAALAPATMVLEIEPAPRPRAFRAQLERHAREMRAMLMAEQPTDAEWWSKQLGTPLEAA